MVHLVGGAVRDLILGNTPADFDLVSNATPQQILVVFSNNKTILIGIAHGTVTVIVSGKPVEITTYRVDSSYI